MSFLSRRLTGSDQPCRYQGKTAYLYLAIIESMIETRPFLFQTVGGIVYHVDGAGVNKIQSWSSEELIMALVDGNKADYVNSKISSGITGCS